METTPAYTDLYVAIDTHLETTLTELALMVAVPSVAAQPDSPMLKGAEVVARLLEKRGLEARILPTVEGAPPVVYAEDRSAGVDAPTVLFYNHYDVQPAEPLELWDSDPWVLRRDGDFLYARGVSDDKGHISCRLLALDAIKSTNGGKLPFNVKVVIEGEEEVASVHLPDWIGNHSALLNADVTIWEFGGVDETGRPEIICGLRGIAYFELHAQTIAYDAHSGVGGSVLPNAGWRLVWALSTLKTRGERILLPGHYDAVLPPSDADMELLAGMPAEQEAFMRKEFAPSDFLGGATGVEYQRRAVFEPTCTICGIETGYTGAGAKTVLPAKAMAKVDFRLVPDQDPETVHAALRKHLDTNGFTDIEIKYLGGQRPGRVDPNHPYVRLAAETARDVYGKEPCVYPLVGGSGPIHPFVAGLRQPVVTCGVGYPGARVHAPNENLRVSDLLLGARHTARFLLALCEQYGKG
ncbi:MAG: M20/M25/M40 family metallo-hydrolase [Fibrella sp.]|nr:M20/M25/M40 family metallo-hydrolase [Armatimonadota bacterium]